MNHLFVPYELAKELKDKGFMQECFGFYYYDGSFKKYRLEYNDPSDLYSDVINAPTYDQVTEWFLSKNMYLDINLSVITFKGSPKYKFQFLIDDIIINDYLYNSVDKREFYNTHKEAQNAAITQALKLIP